MVKFCDRDGSVTAAAAYSETTGGTAGCPVRPVLGRTRRRPTWKSPKVSARTDPNLSQRHRQRMARDDQGCEKAYFNRCAEPTVGTSRQKTAENVAPPLGPRCESCLYRGPVRRAIHSETTQ